MHALSSMWFDALQVTLKELFFMEEVVTIYMPRLLM